MYSTFLKSFTLLISLSTLTIAKVCPGNCDQCPTRVGSCIVTSWKGISFLVSSCAEDCGSSGFLKGNYLCSNYGCNTDQKADTPTPALSPKDSTYTAGWGGLTIYARKDNNEMYVAIWDAATPQVLIGRGWANLKPDTSANFSSRLRDEIVISKPKGAKPGTPWTVHYNGENFTTQDKNYCMDGQGGYNMYGQRTTNCGFMIKGTPGKAYNAGTEDPA